MYIRVWGCLFLLRRFWKNGLEAAKITLWASTCFPSSQARVTSAKSASSLRFPNAPMTFSLKSFHCRQSFSDIVYQVRGRELLISHFCFPRCRTFLCHFLSPNNIHGRRGRSRGMPRLRLGLDWFRHRPLKDCQRASMPPHSNITIHETSSVIIILDSFIIILTPSIDRSQSLFYFEPHICIVIHILVLAIMPLPMSPL